ncbi:MAG: thiamine-phosphate kinase [Crocinitomicaceae bacterium]|nr:thiamine-phosphate kinase [Crocinitomicaceae bacterium]|tara:strand:- start:12798 stop:13847 length:1050 start_codon:yes stop_codon:yes gene_type:complete
MLAGSEDRTELEELGEFGLIDHLTKGLENVNSSTVKGVGDDAAVIDSGDKYTLVSTDMLIEGVHFDLMYAPMKHLGYKAVVVNFSDIYAMNGHPKQITVSLAISNRFSVEALDEFYAGVKLACELYKVDLVGGDTTSSLSGLCVSITAIGEVEKDKIVYRNGANENDLICVSGDLGAAYVGLQLLEREKQIFKENSNIQPDLEGMDYVLERQLKPEARKAVVEMLEKAEVLPTSMIDVSDGLASELLHIASHSNCGVAIYEDKLPIDPATVSGAENLGLDGTVAALNGGEDYELLFTIPQIHFETVRVMEGISIIGHINDRESGYNMISKGNSIIPLTAQGWDSFLSNN